MLVSRPVPELSEDSQLPPAERLGFSQPVSLNFDRAIVR